jgi:hypothetical protein
VVDNYNNIKEHWWNDTDKGKLQYLEKNLSQYYAAHYKPPTDLLGTKHGHLL